MTDAPVGFIGLGEMGSAMAERLMATGADLLVHDLDERAVARAIAGGASAAVSAAEVASVCDVVGVCVPASEHIEAVVAGDRGLVSGSSPDRPSTVLIHSTVHPDTMMWAAAALRSYGTAVHDACVAGGAAAARDGGLVMFVGGLADLAEPARAVVECCGSRVVDAGPVGAGAALKVACNVMTYAQQAAVAAAFDICEGHGASTASLVEAWQHMGQLGSLTEQYLDGLARADDDLVQQLAPYLRSVAGIMNKDLELAADLGVDGRKGPRAVVEAMAAAAAEVMRVPDEA